MSDADRQLWHRMLGHLRAEHPEVCRQWFEDIEPLGMHANTLYLRVQSRVHRDYLRRQCAGAFTDAARTASGHLLIVTFLGPEESMPSVNGVIARSTQPEAVVDGVPRGEVLSLNPDNSFDTFVEGPGNRYALAAANAVADNLGRSYNPLFIHGGVGLGKTHLLQAICLAIRARDAEFRIHYLSCENFVTHYTEAIRAGQAHEFRNWFRDADMLVIDDIHFLADKEGSQEEFFHTFNTLKAQNRQIVLSSDSPPETIPALEQRLVSRFIAGLVTEVEPPDYETRVAILKSKARLRSIPMPDDVAIYIASRINQNIRELEGAITKLQIHASVEKCPVDLELCKRALGDLRPPPSGGPSIQIIINTVTDFYSVRSNDIQSRKRQRSIALPRQVCMYLARKHTRHSLEEIGGYFGGRDHTTVMHAVKIIEARRGHDQDFAGVINSLENKIQRRPDES